MLAWAGYSAHFSSAMPLFQIPGGVLARRFGPRRLLAFSVIWWGLFTALTACVPPGIRDALLVSNSGSRPHWEPERRSCIRGKPVLLNAGFPIGERGKANGIIFWRRRDRIGTHPAGLLTAIILHFGWRASFWFCAAAGPAGWHGVVSGRAQYS